MLGVSLRSVFMPIAGKSILGLLVLGVAVGGTAEAAGISIGDVLIGIGGQLFGRFARSESGAATCGGRQSLTA